MSELPPISVPSHTITIDPMPDEERLRARIAELESVLTWTKDQMVGFSAAAESAMGRIKALEVALLELLQLCGDMECDPNDSAIARAEALLKPTA